MAENTLSNIFLFILTYFYIGISSSVLVQLLLQLTISDTTTSAQHLQNYDESYINIIS